MADGLRQCIRPSVESVTPGHDGYPLAPPVEYIGTRVSARNKRLSEARNASHRHTRVNDGLWLAFASFLQQR